MIAPLILVIELFFISIALVSLMLSIPQISFMVESGFIIATFCEKSYPKKLAYKYLEELRDEFLLRHRDEANSRSLRPFALQKFGTTLTCSRSCR